MPVGIAFSIVIIGMTTIYVSLKQVERRSSQLALDRAIRGRSTGEDHEDDEEEGYNNSGYLVATPSSKMLSRISEGKSGEEESSFFEALPSQTEQGVICNEEGREDKGDSANGINSSSSEHEVLSAAASSNLNAVRNRNRKPRQASASSGARDVGLQYGMYVCCNSKVWCCTWSH